MRVLGIVLVLFLVVACGGGNDEPAATQTTFIISEPEEDPRQPVVVRSFSINADSIRRGQPVKVEVALEAARPKQQLSLDWYGPDGWLVAYEIRDATEAKLVFDAPVRSLDAPGTYRAVLRAGRRPVAEDTLTVAAS